MGKKRTMYKKQEVPFFISKLIAILQNSATQQIIKWSASGKGFQILNQSLLVKNLLPDHFKHHNLASFIRQLNLYGFHKLQNTYEYCHEHFNREEPEQFKLIKRIVKTKNKKLSTNSRRNENKGTCPNNYDLLEKLAEQNQNLKQENQNLMKCKTENLKILRKLRLCMKKSKKNGKSGLNKQSQDQKGIQLQSSKDSKKPCSDPYKIVLYSQQAVDDLMNSYLS